MRTRIAGGSLFRFAQLAKATIKKGLPKQSFFYAILLGKEGQDRRGIVHEHLLGVHCQLVLGVGGAKLRDLRGDVGVILGGQGFMPRAPRTKSVCLISRSSAESDSVRLGWDMKRLRAARLTEPYSAMASAYFN